MQIGDLVRFDYRQGTEVHTHYPTVLVLHPDWICSDRSSKFTEAGVNHRCMHGLTWNYLSNQQINYLRAVLNPLYESQIVQKDPVIAAQMDKIDKLLGLDILSPHDFYLRFVKDFIKPQGWDPYRRFRVDKIRALQVKVPQRQMVGEDRNIFNQYIRKFQFMRGPRLDQRKDARRFR